MTGAKDKEYSLARELPHMVPSIIAGVHNLKGVIMSPSIQRTGGMGALAEAYWLLKQNCADVVIVGGLDFNVNREVMGSLENLGALCKSEHLLKNPD